MRFYRLNEGGGAEGWPFLAAPHAYLADGTPLTEWDEEGRIVPSSGALGLVEKICSGGRLSLADRWNGVEALARALDQDDLVRAPLLLLQLQIDQVSPLAKFNPWHKPAGPGGGQFTTGPETGVESAPADPADEHRIGLDLHVGIVSTYQPEAHTTDINIAHDLVITLVQSAALSVGAVNFRPGMPAYGQKLHDVLAVEVKALKGVSLYTGISYLRGMTVPRGTLGSSTPDIIYGPPDHPLAVWEIKTGRAALNIRAADITAQRARTLLNLPKNPSPLYEYVQVYGK